MFQRLSDFSFFPLEEEQMEMTPYKNNFLLNLHKSTYLKGCTQNKISPHWDTLENYCTDEKIHRTKHIYA